MRLSQVFDDLGEFVRHYRGRISSDGLLLFTNTAYQEGTVLDIDIRLGDDTALLEGRAGVVRLRSGSPEPDMAWTAILQWIDLDRDGRDLLDRLEARETAEGVPPFRLAAVLQAPGGPVLRVDGTGRSRAAGTTPAGDEPASGEIPPPAEPAERDTIDRIGEMVSSALGAGGAGPAAGGGNRHGSSSGRRPSAGAGGRLTQIARWALGIGAVAVLVATIAMLWLPELRDRGGGATTPTTVAGADARNLRAPAPDEGPAAASQPSPAALVPTDPTGTAPAATVAAGPAADDEPAPLPTAATTPTAAANPPPSGDPTPSRMVAIVGLDVEESDDGAVVVVRATAPLDPGDVVASRLDAPPGPRAVLRIRRVASSTLPTRLEVGGPRISAVRCWLHDDRTPPELHVVADLETADLVLLPVEVRGAEITLRLAR